MSIVRHTNSPPVSDVFQKPVAEPFCGTAHSDAVPATPATLEQQPDGSVVLTTSDKDLSLPAPAVVLEKLKLVATFTRDANGVWRATGTLAATNVALGENALGPGSGPAHGRSLSPAQTPPDLPRVVGR